MIGDAGWLVGQWSGERNVTLASKRKMSQRQKTSRSSQSTQTDLSSSCSSWSLLDAAPINGVAGPGDLSLYTNSEMPLSPAGVTVGATGLLPSSSSAAEAAAVDNANQQFNGEFYEDAATLFDKLVKAEEVGGLDMLMFSTSHEARAAEYLL